MSKLIPTLAFLLSFLVTCGADVAAQTKEAPELVQSRELNAKVVTLYREAKYEEALPLAKRALELREAALGASHQELIPLLKNLAELSRATKKFAQARASLDRALTIAEIAFTQNDVRIAQILHLLGVTSYEQGKERDAERFFVRALAIKDKVLGPEHVESAPTLFNLAEMYRSRRDYKKAEPLYERLVGIREKAPGKNNAELQRAVTGYVITLANLEKTAEADAAQDKLNRLLASEGVVLGGVLNGKALKLEQPGYPMTARSERAAGMVRVQILIDETGRVISANAINAGSTHPALQAAAEEAARRSRFTPTYLSGVAVKVSGVIIYNFIAQ